MERKRDSRSTIWVILFAAFIIVLIICASCAVVFNAVTNLFPSSERLVPSQTPPSGATLTVAYSPEKQALFEELVRGFNAQKLMTEQGDRMTVRSVELEPEAMIERAQPEISRPSAPTCPSGWISSTGIGWSRPGASRRWWARPFATL